MPSSCISVSLLRWICIMSGVFMIITHISGYINDESQLMRDLLSTDRYDIKARPVRNCSKTVLVSCVYSIDAILNIDEKYQTFTVYGWIALMWQDEFLQWTPSDYGNISLLTMSSINVWMPDIINRNSAKEVYGDILDKTKFDVGVFSTGLVGSGRAGVTVTSCVLDVTYFPFDSQSCYIELDSWSRSSSKVSLKVFENVRTSTYTNNSEWELVSTEVSNETIPGYDGFAPYDMVCFTFHLKRKPTYFVLMIIIPCVIQSLMTVLVFLVPPESGEKISLQITILLSFSVFQLTIADSIPKTSDYTPIISIYVNSIIILASVSLFISVLILRLHHAPRDVKHLPNWRRLVPRDAFNRLFRSNVVQSDVTHSSAIEKIKEIVECKPNQVSLIADEVNKVHQELQNVKTIRNKADENNCALHYRKDSKEFHPSGVLSEQKTLQIDYGDLARKCDILFFFFFSIMVIIISLVVFLMIYTGSQKTK